MFTPEEYERFKKQNPDRVKPKMTNFMDMVHEEDKNDMMDPKHIMGNVQSSAVGYGSLHALEGDSKP